ncbi:MAG: hypothetical protein FWD89_00360 [Firmicutes bacterium]|nr:hypothetical protein [Bacillota bacterium]
MAIITKIDKGGEKKLTRAITYCEAEYNEYFEGHKNEKFVGIQTFGSKDRVDQGKQSQVIHLNKETAIKLVELLRKSFNL